MMLIEFYVVEDVWLFIVEDLFIGFNGKICFIFYLLFFIFLVFGFLVYFFVFEVFKVIF